MSIHHKPIKSFAIDGAIKDDAHIIRLKEEYIRLLIIQMRETGYIPRIDIEPDFTLEYDNKKDCFEFKLTVYGIYVGKKRVEWIIAADGYREIHIRKTKSKEFLSDQESPLSQR